MHTSEADSFLSKMKGKKAQSAIDGLQNLIVPLVGVGIVLVVGFLIIAEVKTQVLTTEATSYPGCNATNSSCGYGYNATVDTQDAMSDIPTWLPIIIITVIGAVLIGLVSRFRKS